MSELKNFNSLLEYYRYHKARHGLTQDQLRRRWGLKRQSHVHALLYGKCQPRPRLARTICEDTGLDLYTVFRFDSPGNGQPEDHQMKTRSEETSD